jgi:hypothetical protein
VHFRRELEKSDLHRSHMKSVQHCSRRGNLASLQAITQGFQIFGCLQKERFHKLKLQKISAKVSTLHQSFQLS